ncbi:IS66-like element accessory protein TnpA, partial [Sphingomonas sp. Leaf208]|jgi:transposase|uniref:IS66-like element accessory protein TnpA n=2 Tax=Sphingomonadaceae TaxID=41297 RepID=UPI001F424EFA
MSDETIEPAADVASSHTTGRMSGRIEIVGRVSGRRRWTVEEKLAILRDAFGPDGSVRAAVERHEVGSGAIYTWRRQAMSGALSGVPARPQTAFAEVQISEPPMMLPAPPVEAPADARTAGQIGIELPSGVRLTVDGTVDAEALSRVIGVLTR